jgi:hypothetical protein
MSNFEPLERLSILMESVRGLPNQMLFVRRGHIPGKKRSPLEKIDYCSQALLFGALPDVETLLFVAEAFYRYVHSDGTISLDEAFRLKSKPKVGNPVRQRDRERKIAGLLFSMALHRACNPKVSIAKAAEAALGNDESIEVETLKREYIRRGCKQSAEAFARGPQGK